jgi:hypothetical protein
MKAWLNRVWNGDQAAIEELMIAIFGAFTFIAFIFRS